MRAKTISPLIKVFPDQELTAQEYTHATALGNEYFDLQIAYCADETMRNLSLIIESNLPHIEFGSVGCVISDMPTFKQHDEYLLRTTPGLYPDPIYPCTGKKDVTAIAGQWRSIFVTIKTDIHYKGKNTIKFILKNEETDTILVELPFCLEIIPCNLPKQKLIHTEWFHFDCLATFHNVNIFSDEHWQIIENYLKNYTEHGMNMILTPIFTPPLDTEIGHERPTVQLVDVTLHKNGKYSFVFDKLLKWINLCKKHGIEYFEISHMFTQWGAKHAPKIIVNVDGKDTKYFGWHTDAHGDEYKSFLGEFIPALIKVIEQQNIQCYFHISDEPSEEMFDFYQSASKTFKMLTGNRPIMDALSEYRFYEENLLDIPIVATNYIKPFLEKNIENLWAYYCCGQFDKTSNRFFNMSGSRTRILGVQLYKFNIKGFLHWGYNFWYTGRSINQKINPYSITDAGAHFPSGDAFLVYPHPHGEFSPVNSIRIKYMREAMQDISALMLLETLVGKEKTIAYLEEYSVGIDFENYERDDNWILQTREKINAIIKRNL